MYSKNLFLKRIKFYWFAQLGIRLNFSTRVFCLISKWKVWLTSGEWEFLCPLFFINFLFFHQVLTLQKLWKMFFISCEKLFSFSRYSNFCNVFSFHTFHIQKSKWNWNNLWCHKFTDINFHMEFLELTQKLLCITNLNR